MKAKILSYSRSRGLFAGIELKGVTLHQDEDANKAVYGKPMSADEILKGVTPAPASSKPLINILTKYTPKGV